MSRRPSTGLPADARKPAGLVDGTTSSAALVRVRLEKKLADQVRAA